MNIGFFKKKKFYIPTSIILLLSIFVGYGQYKKATAPPSYETVKVVRGDIKQSVEATGKIEAVDDLVLRFEIPGTIGKVSVSEGQKVVKGQILAQLRLNELNAAVAAANANLNKQLAGATQEDKDYYAAAADSAKASLEQTKVDIATSIAAAEAAVATAKNNLKLAEGGDQSKIVSQTYEAAVGVLQVALSQLDDALTQADNILGLDNTLANESFRSVLASLNPTALNQAYSNYQQTKQMRQKTKTLVSSLTIQSSHASIDEALLSMESAFSSANTLLLSVSEVLSATPPIGNLTQATLDAKKTIIESSRGKVTSQYATLINQKQLIFNSKNSLVSYTIAYNKAVNDLEQTKTNSDNLIKIKEAIYNQAVANLQARINPPRSVDVAPYRAALAQAVANRDKGIIRAPIDGVVTKVGKKTGELISGGDVMINLLSPHYEVNVDISEIDVRKISVGDEVAITLDAFGTDAKFTGNVMSIDPGPTVIQDVVYYKVRINISDTELPIKPGMTANISVATDLRTSVLYVPSRAVKFNAEEGRYVMVLEQGVEKEYPVKVGLKANEGKLEIIEGLREGQVVILSKQEKK